MSALTSIGAGALVAWGALPVLARVAPRSAEEPASRHRALTLTLVLGAALVAIPALRAATHHATAVPLSLPADAGAFPALTAFPAPAVLPSGLAWVGAAWLALVAASLLGTARDAFLVGRMCARGRVAPAWLVALARRVAHEAGQRELPVLVSREAGVPFVTGVLRPRIVLPAALVDDLDDARLALVLRHELTHVARGDLRSALVVALARAAFVLHPTARWLGREIAIAREEAVDAVVGVDAPVAYAHLLLDVAAASPAARSPRALVAMDASSLARRLAWVGQSARRTPARTSRLLVAGALFVALGLTAPHPVWASASAWASASPPNAAPIVTPPTAVADPPEPCPVAEHHDECMHLATMAEASMTCSACCPE